MTSIQAFRDRLNRQSSNAVMAINPGDDSCLKEDRTELNEWINFMTGLFSPEKRRIIAAVLAFRREHRLETLLQVRLASHGCNIIHDHNTSYLIEDPTCFPILLDYVDKLSNRPRLFRRCFKGLMNTYFSYEPGIVDPIIGRYQNRDAGWKNRQRLRQFLDFRKNCLEDSGFNPDWITAIQEHPSIFSANPCSPYVDAALKNDFTAFEDICKRLNISKASWFARGLIYEQVDEIIEKDDDEFKQHIDHTLNLFTKHRWSTDKSLPKIVNRYVSTEEKDTNHPSRLRDFSVSHWQNPWLPTLEYRWRPIEKEAKQLITTWIKQHLLRQFFWLLTQGTPYDVRRGDFWMRYHHNIDDIYFALGSSAIHNSTRDFVEIRNTIEGRIVGLYRSGLPTNNAIIIMMRNHVFVEFSDNNSELFIFDRRTQLPFELKRGFKVAGEELKNTRSGAFVQKLAHLDTPEKNWENNFDDAFRKLGIWFRPQL